MSATSDPAAATTRTGPGDMRDPGQPDLAGVPPTTAAALAEQWWSMVMRGLIAIVFGVIALIWPVPFLTALALAFGGFALADGVLALFTAFRAGARGRRWWPFALEGVAGIAIGLIAIISPALTALTLVAFIGAWAIITGILELVAAVKLREEIEGEWLLGFAGALSILFGLFAVFSPGQSAVGLVWIVGAYAVVFGITLVMLGLRLRAWRPVIA